MLTFEELKLLELTTIQCPALVKEGLDKNGRPSVERTK
jgi:hypothetical protein